VCEGQQVIVCVREGERNARGIMGMRVRVREKETHREGDREKEKER